MLLGRDIRTRLLITAVLPVTLVCTLLTALFLIWRSDALEVAHASSQRSVARQLALAVEYPLFVGNVQALQALLDGALLQHRLVRALVLDARGRVVVAAGDVGLASPFVLGGRELTTRDLAAGRDWLAQPVMASRVVLDDVYEDRISTGADTPQQLGQVVMAFSGADAHASRGRLLFWGGLLGLMGALMGAGLAVWLSRGVLRPIERVKTLIARIGAGDFGSATSLQPIDWQHQPLGEVLQHLQAMASQLANVQQRLQAEVASATEALRARTDEAEQATQAKSHFLAAASHDLRQPLQAIGMFVTRLNQLTHDAPTQVVLGQLESAVYALQDLLDGLLDLSRLEAHAVLVRVQPIALRPLVEQVLADVMPMVRSRGLHMRVHVRADLAVLSDATLLHRIVLNLVSNATKYTERGGVLVGARLSRNGRWVRLQVWDTGVGIAPEHQALVYREFFRVDAPDGSRQVGMGLGLSIVQRSAQLLGHGLRLLSRPGRGSMFELTLPVASVSQVQALQAPVPPTEPTDHFDGQTVLVVEDDALVRAALVGLLNTWGLRVAEASDGASALQQVAQGLQPQVVLSDYRLPGGLDGLALLARLREQLGVGLSAALISGDTLPELMVAARSAGVMLLHKPTRPAKLRALLRHFLKT